MQFHGEYQHRVDPQGRVAIPARYREEFTRGIYLTRGFDQCIWAFSPTGWDAYSSRYAAMSPSSRVARTLRRRVFGSTFDLELDRQGRVVLPLPLRQFAGLQEEVVIVGAGTWLELWDSSRWGEMMEEIDAADMDSSEDDREAGE